MKAGCHPNIHIRRAGLNRLEDLLKLEKLCYSTDGSARRNMRKQLGSPSAFCLGAYQHGNFVGCLIMVFRSGNRHARIRSLAVTPSARHQGIGYSMMIRAQKEAGIRRASLIRMEVRLGNVPAIRLCERLGYAAEEIVPSNNESDPYALTYRKYLQPQEKKTHA